MWHSQPQRGATAYDGIHLVDSNRGNPYQLQFSVPGIRPTARYHFYSKYTVQVGLLPLLIVMVLYPILMDERSIHGYTRERDVSI